MQGRSAARPGIRAALEVPPRIIAAMLLAVDIGNTNITLGLFRDGALLATRRAATGGGATADEIELLLDGLLAPRRASLRRRSRRSAWPRSCPR